MILRPELSCGVRQLRAFLLLFACCSALPSIASADSLTTTVRVLSSSGNLAPSNFVSSCPQTSTVATGSTTITCSKTVVVSGADLSFAPPLVSAGATGSLSSGTIGATAEATLVPGFTPGLTAAQQSDLLAVYGLENHGGVSSIEGNAVASISYNFAVSGPSSGTVSLSLQADGSQSISDILAGYNGEGEGLTEAFVTISSSETFAGVSGPSLLLQSGTTLFNVTIPYVNGVATFSLNLGVEASCSDGNTVASYYPSGTGPSNGTLCSSTADYINTVSITGDSVYDANGNLVSGATIVSDSGFNPNAIPTPEPSSLLFLGAGLLALAGITKLKLRVS